MTDRTRPGADAIRLIAAADAVARILADPMTANSLAPMLTCDEASDVNALIEASGGDGSAFRAAHAAGDDDPEDLHHGGWIF
jgi:hypothetical protein